VLRGNVGDEFVVTLVNRTDMDHSLDFHAASQPMQAMTEAVPGRPVTYVFRAQYSGIYLYHCGTPPVPEHLANGMFGAVIINPPHLPAVPEEFLIVQSELYPGPQRRRQRRQLVPRRRRPVHHGIQQRRLPAGARQPGRRRRADTPPDARRRRLRPVHRPGRRQYEMLDRRLDHVLAGAAGYIDASAPGG
jgi:FtsP/CotA-like multicopper oxidase with cupredoxin domain